MFEIGSVVEWNTCKREPPSLVVDVSPCGQYVTTAYKYRGQVHERVAVRRDDKLFCCRFVQ